MREFVYTNKYRSAANTILTKPQPCTGCHFCKNTGIKRITSSGRRIICYGPKARR
jgi:hypothetical protein